MTVDELQAILTNVLPVQAYREVGLHGGKVTWTFPYNIWKLSYAASGGNVGTIVLNDHAGLANVSLSREGVNSFLAILKAVGAV